MLPNLTKAELLLMLLVSARATSFMFSKLCLTTMDSFSLLGIRFLLASAIMLVIFHKKLFHDFYWQDMLKGMLFGSLFWATMSLELIGLKTTDSGLAAFLENLAIIIVPILLAIINRQLPGLSTVKKSFLAILGVGFLTLNNTSFSFTTGMLYLLGAAHTYALTIIATYYFSRNGNAFTMGFFQILTISILSLFIKALTGNFITPTSMEQWYMILYLTIICTCFGFVLQPVAQSKVSAERTSLFCALAPLVASILGIVFLSESFTLYTFIGEILILLALVIK